MSHDRRHHKNGKQEGVAKECTNNDHGSPKSYPSIKSRRFVTPTVNVLLPDGQISRQTRWAFLACPALAEKIFWFSEVANHWHNLRIPSHRGAVRDRHGRGMGCGGRGSAFDERR